MMRKEKIKKYIDNAPLPKSHTTEKHSVIIATEIGCIISCLLIVLGGICIFFTDQFYEKLPSLIGEVMIALGTADVVRGFCTGEYKNKETKLTSNGIVNLLLGFSIIHFKSDSYMIIGAIWGTMGLIKGSEELNKAICAIAGKEPFIKKLISAVIELVLGILLLLKPDGNLHHHIFILGLELIVRGIRYIRKALRGKEV